MGAAEEEQDGHALPGEVVVVGAEVEVFRRPDVVDRPHVELSVRRADAVQRRAEIRMLFADRHDRVFPVAADHVDVEIGHDVADRHGRMVGEIRAAPQALLLAAHVQEDDRALRPRRHSRQGFGDFHHRDGSRAVIIGAVANRVRALSPAAAAAARPRDAYVVHVRAEHDELVLEDRVAARQDAHHVRREPALHDPYPGMHV